jgi:hypothetical protein
MRATFSRRIRQKLSKLVSKVPRYRPAIRQGELLAFSEAILPVTIHTNHPDCKSIAVPPGFDMDFVVANSKIHALYNYYRANDNVFVPA